MAEILGMLQHKDVCQDAGLVLALLRVVKVLTRKQGNRLQFGGSGLHQVCAGVSVCACVCGFSFLAVGVWQGIWMEGSAACPAAVQHLHV